MTESDAANLYCPDCGCYLVQTDDELVCEACGAIYNSPENEVLGNESPGLLWGEQADLADSLGLHAAAKYIRDTEVDWIECADCGERVERINPKQTRCPECQHEERLRQYRVQKASK